MNKKTKFQYFFFLFKSWIYRLYYRLKRFFTKEPLLGANFLEVSARLPAKGFLLYKLVENPWFFRILGTFSSVCTLVGFMALILELQKALAISTTILAICFFFYLFMVTRIQEDALIQMVATYSYILMVLPLFWSSINLAKVQDIRIEDFLKLVVIVGLLRPFWKNLVEFMFFLGVKRFHSYGWFRKLLPYLTPGFDPKKFKDWKDEDKD